MKRFAVVILAVLLLATALGVTFAVNAGGQAGGGGGEVHMLTP